MIKVFNKFLKKSNKNSIKEVQIYTYKFPNGKIYIGYTSRGLDWIHRCHKHRIVTPVTQYLNNPEQCVEPIEEKKVTIDVNGNDIYKIEREILDKYTTDTSKILNKNLYLWGY